MEDNGKIMCPSSKAQKGAMLLGILQDDGKVSILPQPLRIDETFIETAGHQRPAEEQFRFTNKCVESGCSQWTGKRCGVADKVLSVLNDLPPQNEVPVCALRPSCRWHLQSGEEACRACVFVITHTTEDDWDAQQQTELSLKQKLEH